MTFDPSVYASSDHQTEPTRSLSEADWVKRFVASVIAQGTDHADDEFKEELPQYAASVAQSYLADRMEYATPEEAAWVDISYWESEE